MTDYSYFPQTVPTDDTEKITSESYDTRTLEISPAQQKEKT